MNFGGMRPPKVRAPSRRDARPPPRAARSSPSVPGRFQSPPICGRMSRASRRVVLASRDRRRRAAFARAARGAAARTRRDIATAPRTRGWIRRVGVATSRAVVNRPVGGAARERRRDAREEKIYFFGILPTPPTPRTRRPHRAATSALTPFPPALFLDAFPASGRQRQVLQRPRREQVRRSGRDQKGVPQGGHQESPGQGRRRSQGASAARRRRRRPSVTPRRSFVRPGSRRRGRRSRGRSRRRGRPPRGDASLRRQIHPRDRSTDRSKLRFVRARPPKKTFQDCDRSARPNDRLTSLATPPPPPPQNSIHARSSKRSPPRTKSSPTPRRGRSTTSTARRA